MSIDAVFVVASKNLVVIVGVVIVGVVVGIVGGVVGIVGGDVTESSEIDKIRLKKVTSLFTLA